MFNLFFVGKYKLKYSMCEEVFDIIRRPRNRPKFLKIYKGTFDSSFYFIINLPGVYQNG